MAHLSMTEDSRPRLLLSLREDVTLSEQIQPGVLRTLLDLLSVEDLTDEQLAGRCAQRVPQSAGAIFYHIDQLMVTGLLQRQLVDDQGPLATLIPIGSDEKLSGETASVDTIYQLCTFCYLRASEGALLLQSPLAHAKLVLLSDRALTLFHRLATPTTLRSATKDGILSLHTAQLLGTLLLHCRAIIRRDQTEKPSTSSAAKLSQWDFHDLLFHSRSRLGRHDGPAGKTYPYLNRHAPLPALKPPMSSRYVQLQEVSLAAIEQDDPPFTAVLEGRRSLSSQSTSPITIKQLGELLYRAARVRAHLNEDKSSPPYYEYTSRPYPSGGCAHELEIYVAVNRCSGLNEGLYHYHAAEHRLYHLSKRTPEVERLLQDAHQAIATRATPELLFIITARHQRLSWAYQSISYATTLKNVGVLFQTLYLVATAMKLSVCALGVGNADLFAKASGLDYCRESSVGEFVVNGAKLNESTSS